jgi:hypothetical protein
LLGVEITMPNDDDNESCGIRTHATRRGGIDGLAEFDSFAEFAGLAVFDRAERRRL